MFTVSCSEEIDRPPEAVFAFAGDYANDPRWRTGVLDMAYEAGSTPTVGARTRETMRSMCRTVVTVAEVVEYSPTRTAFRSVSGPVSCDGSREFTRSPQGTTFTYALTIRPNGPLRLLEPLLRVALARQVRRDVRQLKRVLEASA
jgi:hypothetical protein